MVYGLPHVGPHYTYRVEWSPDHGAYAGRCLEWPTYFEMAPSPREALDLIEATIRGLVAEYISGGMEPPTALTEHCLLYTSDAADE